MKVVLINPPSLYLENDAAYPPMGLLYLAAVIKIMGEHVEILDLSLFDEIEKPLLYAIEGADLVGITCSTPNIPIVKKIVGLIHPSIPIIVGGPHPTFEPFNTFNELKGVSILTGEGESAIRQVILDLRNNGGIIDYYEGGIVNISDVPKPARDLINLSNYSPGGISGAPVYTSRGCSFSCSFCSKISGRNYRNFPLKMIDEEVKEVVDQGIKHVVFGDDDIGLNSDLIWIMTDIMGEYNSEYGTTYRLNMSARLKSKNIIKIASETGCTEISLGVESGNNEMLVKMHKNLTVDRAEEAIKLVKDQGIKIKIYLMINFPGETKKTVEDTIRFVERTKPDSVFISSFVPLPGSEVYENPLKYGITWMSQNWENYYTVGVNRSFGHCFETKELTYKKQWELHTLLLKGVGLL